MLLLSRKIGETVVINETIRVTVVRVDGDRVKFGIEAPPEVQVDREEIFIKRQLEKSA